MMQDAKVEDYLNDKLQTESDLDTLQDLLRSVQEKESLLHRQHAEASNALQAVWAASEDNARDAARRVKAFRKAQSDIDRRLMVLTRSETSDDAVRKFGSVISKLRRLETAQSYVNLLREAERLGPETRREFKASPQAALKPYLKIKGLASALKAAQPVAENAAPHLVNYVEKSAQSLWEQMKDAFAQDFEFVLAQIQWPHKDASLDGTLEQEWISGVERLLDLQQPELEARARETRDSLTHGQLVLLPLEIMVKPLHLRFKYHFDGDRATNKIDKPEFFFAHVLDLVSSYDDFFVRHLEPVLERHFQSDLWLDSLYTNSTDAWITALLPMLRQKIFALLPSVSKRPQLFSHLIHEIIKFDQALAEDWGYLGDRGADGWYGLAWEVLAEQKWFGKWLEVEKDFALSRYDSIVTPTESRRIDYDSVDPEATKPTKAAIRVHDLLDTVTDRYRSLPSFHYKLRFLVEIQITIFDKFHQTLHSSLEACVSLTSSFVRTVQTVPKEELAKIEGVGGLDRLCRVYGSAEYLERKLRDWNDNVFFIDLWDALQQRVKSKADRAQALDNDLSFDAIAEQTTQVVGTKDDSGALFAETAGTYRRLRIQAEEALQEKLSYDLRESLRQYGRVSSWAYVASDTSNLTTSPELSVSLEQITAYLAFLSRALARVSLRRIVRQLCQSLQSYLWDHVLMRNNFSTNGVTQFQNDLAAIWDAINRFAGPGQGQTGMRKLREAAELLSMPTEAANDDAEGPEAMHISGIVLSDVEKRLFTDNDSARAVLEELNFESLIESDARSLVEKRVDLAS